MPATAPASASDTSQSDEPQEQWLREDVLPVARKMTADPQRGLTTQDVFDEIRSLHATVGWGARCG